MFIFTFGYVIVCLNYIQFPADFQLIPINCHKFAIRNIAKIPDLNFPWKVSGNLPEFFTPLQPQSLHRQLVAWHAYYGVLCSCERNSAKERPFCL